MRHAPERVQPGPADGEASSAGVVPMRGVGALRAHVVPLLTLATAHALVFARSLFPTSAGLYYVAWDFDSSYHRYLVYVGDCLRSGIWPLWNPYTGAGTPFFANPQNQLWSPVTLVVGSLLGYTHDVAQQQLILTMLFGGVGAYALSHTLWRDRSAAFVSAAVFDLTSGMFSNAEHLDIVNAYALLPWWFWAATRAAEGHRLAFPALAFLVYWAVVGGYPAVVGMGLVWLVMYVVYLAFRRFSQGRERTRFILHAGAAGITALGLSAVHWISVLSALPAFSRGKPLDPEFALGGGLSFAHLWGMIFNFTTVTPFEGNVLDLSMVGLYVGAVALPLVGVSLLRESGPNARLLAVAGGSALLMSTGSLFFVRYALHWVVPAFNYSRFPSTDSRMVMMLALALLAGSGAHLVFEDRGSARELARRLYAAELLLLLVALPVLRAVAYPKMNQAEYTARIVGGISAQVVFVAGAIVLLLRRGRRQFIAGALSALLLIDMGTDVVLNYGMLGYRVTPAQRQERESAYRHDFRDVAATGVPRIRPEPPNPDLVSEFSLQGLTSKRFYLADYGGFRLERFNGLRDRGFTDWLATGPRVVALPPSARPQTFSEFRDAIRPIAYHIIAYRPDLVRYEVETASRSLLAFNEMYFPGWSASVDGVSERVIEVAGGLRGVTVEPGTHDVLMRFRPRPFFIGLLVSAATAVALLWWVGVVLWRDRHHRRPMRDEPADNRIG